MGKFGIGARVRDDGGDEGVIVEKAKGQRLVSYDYAAYGKIWQAKARLTALPANDNICAETSENAYVGSDGEAVSAWVPKVGDRVRFRIDNPNGGATYGRAGEDFVVVEVDPDNLSYYGRQVAIDHSGGLGFKPRAPISALEPVVAPATTWTPAVGDRVRNIGETGYDSFPIGATGRVVEPMATHGVWASSDLDGWNGFFFFNELEPAPLTIEAGKFYRTRDGRKVGPAQVGGPFNVGTDDQGRKAFAYILGQGDYTVDGIWLSGNGNECPDLVAEWVEPAVAAVVEATEDWQPAIGDKVRCTDDSGATKFTVGEIYTVRKVGKDGLVHVEENSQCMFAYRFEPVAVAEATATPWSGQGKPGLVVRCDEWGGELFTPGRVYTFDANGEVAANDGSKFEGIWAGKFSIVEPAAPPAKFKVGDRVNYNLTKTAWQCVVIDKIYASGSLSGIDPATGRRGSFHEDWLELAPAIPIGATVTFTATGRLSAYTTDGHAQIVFPGLTPGKNSFALPAAFVALAN